MQPRLIAIALLCAGAIAFACGPRPRESEASPAPVKRPPTTERTTPLSTEIASSFSLSVASDVELRLHVTNSSTKRLELTFPSGQTHDFYVLDSTGREVWRWSKGRMFTQALQKKLLESGSTMAYSEAWDAPDTGGTFTAVAVLRSTSHPVEKRVEFTLQ